MTIQRNLQGLGIQSGAARAIAGTLIDGVTAVGTTQADALLISNDTTIFSTVNSGTGCVLPVGDENDSYLIVNDGANTLKVYPPVGGTINGGATNAPYSLTAGANIDLFYVTLNTIKVRESDEVLRADLAASSGSSLVGFIQSGVGAVTRTEEAKLRDHVSSVDFATPTQAVAAIALAGDGTLFVPNNITPTLPASLTDVVVDYQSTQVFNVYNLSESDRSARRLIRAQESTHSGTEQISLIGVEYRPLGSGLNGPSNADIGYTISVIKQDWANTSVQGEIDGLNIAIRQGGAAGGTNNDAGAILIDASTVTGSGWLGAFEAATRTVQAETGTTLKSLRTQVGVIDSTVSVSVGLYASAEAGVLGDGVRIDTNGGTWENFLHYIVSGNSLFRVDENGRIVLKAASGSTPSKTIRALSGNLSVLNDAQDTQILVLTDAGALSVLAGISSTLLTASEGLRVATTVAGTDDALLINSSGAGTWDNYMRCTNLAGVDIFAINSAGNLVLKAASGLTPSKKIRVNNGALTVVNDASTIQILALADDGGLSITGGFTAASEISSTTLKLTADAVATSAGALALGKATSATATAGAATLPANPTGFLNGFLGSTAIRIPYYAS